MRYFGSKNGAGVYQTIIALMPPHDTYIELFAGSAAVYKRKPKAALNIIIDRDAAAIRITKAEPNLLKIQGDARAFLATFDYAGHGRVLVYADPPYPHSTRTSSKRYRYELSDAEHLELISQLKQIPALVIISSYPSELYSTALNGWQTHEFQAMTRGGVRTEKLWYNFTASAVHHATYAGKNFTERQRIKRKAHRWAEMYTAMPPGERAAVLAAILSVDLPQLQPARSPASRRAFTRRPTETIATIDTGVCEVPCPSTKN